MRIDELENLCFQLKLGVVEYGLDIKTRGGTPYTVFTQIVNATDSEVDPDFRGCPRYFLAPNIYVWGRGAEDEYLEILIRPHRVSDFQFVEALIKLRLVESNLKPGDIRVFWFHK